MSRILSLSLSSSFKPTLLLSDAEETERRYRALARSIRQMQIVINDVSRESAQRNLEGEMFRVEWPRVTASVPRLVGVRCTS